MVIAAVATLIFLSALALGVNDTMIRNSVGLYGGHISGIALPFSIQPERLQVNGTTGVLKRIVLPGALAYGNRLQHVNLIGVDPLSEKKYTAIWKKTIDGRYLRNKENTIFLSQTLAERLAVQVGSMLKFSSEFSDTPVELVVSGVYQTGIDFFDRGIAFCPYTAVTQKADTWLAAVFVQEGYDPDAIVDEYRRTLPAGPEFKSWKKMMPDLVQLIDLNYLSMSIVMVLVFGVVSVGIACAFVIFILKNIREYGIMKAMGVTSREMTLLILSEVLLMNLVACGVGILAGVMAVSLVGQSGIDLSGFTSHNRYFAVSGIIFPRLTFYSLVVPPALAIFFSMVSAVWPTVLVARKKAADILRIV
jgi:ABC-type lipoprotein release transport system permease subunit